MMKVSHENHRLEHMQALKTTENSILASEKATSSYSRAISANRGGGRVHSPVLRSKQWLVHVSIASLISLRNSALEHM